MGKPQEKEHTLIQPHTQPSAAPQIIMHRTQRQKKRGSHGYLRFFHPKIHRDPPILPARLGA